eukprot:1160051-Pelagomonas_calceolata.AAC.2
MRLTDEYKRITEQFKDLQGKFRHFELVDTKKYTEDAVPITEHEAGRPLFIPAFPTMLIRTATVHALTE